MTTDFDLLDAWGRGDQAAGSELFHRHLSSVFSFFDFKVSEGADDLVQQTFMACVEGRDRFARRSSFKSYLFGTARNVLREALRQRRRNAAAPGPEDERSLHDDGPSPPSLLAERGDRRLLLEALRRIPLDHQIALELYYWESMTGPELAAALGLTEPAVRSRLRRALEQLRRALAQLQAEPQVLRSTQATLTAWAQALQQQLPSGEDSGG